MSLILDALKRAQDNRQAAENPASPADLLPPPQPAAPAKSLRGFLLLIIILLMAILIMLWSLLKKTHEPDVIISGKSVSSAFTGVAEPVMEQSKLSSSISSQPSTASSLISDLYQKTNSSSPGIKDVQIAQLYVESEPAVLATEEEMNPSVSVVNPLPDVNSELPDAMQVTPEIRSINDLADVTTFEELSLKQKQLFPSINYSQHNYLGNSASSVVINGELMRVRSRIAEGIEIIDILEDGIVLNLNGRRVSFKALNSWINM